MTPCQTPSNVRVEAQSFAAGDNAKNLHFVLIGPHLHNALQRITQMLPNCPLSLANPNTEKVKTMIFILAEAEKSDLVFCCHRSFALIFTCFLCVCFSQAHKHFVLYISLAFVHMICVHPCFLGSQENPTFFHLNLSQCILNSSLSQICHIPLSNHWKIVMLQFFNSLDIVMAIFVYRTYFFCQIIFLTASVTLNFLLREIKFYNLWFSLSCLPILYVNNHFSMNYYAFYFLSTAALLMHQSRHAYVTYNNISPRASAISVTVKSRNPVPDYGTIRETVLVIKKSLQPERLNLLYIVSQIYFL